jgi:hypothetical protein
MAAVCTWGRCEHRSATFATLKSKKRPAAAACKHSGEVHTPGSIVVDTTHLSNTTAHQTPFLLCTGMPCIAAYACCCMKVDNASISSVHFAHRQMMLHATHTTCNADTQGTCPFANTLAQHHIRAHWHTLGAALLVLPVAETEIKQRCCFLCPKCWPVVQTHCSHSSHSV